MKMSAAAERYRYLPTSKTVYTLGCCFELRSPSYRKFSIGAQLVIAILQNYATVAKADKM